MKRTLVLSMVIAFMATSCVSKKIFNELEGKYADLKKENRKLSDNNGDLTKTKNLLETDLKNTKDELARISGERNQLQSELAAANNQLKTLQASYAALERNSDDALQANMKKNRELLAQLDAKEKALAAEQERLTKLQNDLRERSQRVDELERMMAAKEENMRRLRETLSKALNSFEGKGLTVNMKDGKVYVSMENKLLFQTGSWAVGTEGRRAIVEVGKVLAQNPDISVLIEGHTDNVAFVGSGPISDNWDLSTKRATAIVTILAENKGINRQNLTAAGRGEYAPLASNETAEGKAKNRRIEIILT
ncbi:MAG: OmpA family protein, partial [Flavobacterium sp.]